MKRISSVLVEASLVAATVALPATSALAQTVVDTVGFNGRTWLDYVGHPGTEKLHVIERYRRPDFNTLSYEATIEDPVAYTKPWTTSLRIYFRPGWDLLEYVCIENNKDLLHLGTTEPE
jgi:hypothetical protein